MQIVNKHQCYGCGSCVQECSQHAINMKMDTNGFYYPEIDQTKCIECGQCKNVCPALWVRPGEGGDYKFYSGYYAQPEVVLKSSSGGMFHSIAEWIIKMHGVVFGAAYTDDYMVAHRYVETMEDLELLYRSKYVQSKIGNTYQDVVKFLKQDRWVFFVGSSCQVAGLKRYLKKDYDKLITMDYVCGSAFSPEVYMLYLKELESNARSRITEVNFRDKSKATWKDFYFTIYFENGTEYREKWYENAYIQGAFSKLYTRDSCFNCQYKKMNSGSDFTCGDMWKKNQVLTKEEEQGISVLIVKTKKAERLFREISDRLIYHRIQVEAMRETSHLFSTCTRHPNAEKFRESMHNGKYDSLTQLIWKNLTISEKNGIEELGKKFGVFGSWNTRAVLRKLVDDQYRNKMSYQITKTSLISQYSKKVYTQSSLDTNVFRKRMVNDDLNKEYRTNIEKYLLDTDILLIDFLDERFEVAKVENQEGYITISDAYCEIYKENDLQYSIIDENTRKRLWKEACIQYIDRLKKCLDPENVYLLKMYLMPVKGCNGIKIERFFNQDWIQRINRRIAEYYTFFEKHFPGIHVIEVKSDDWEYTDIMHKYGCVPEHMNDVLYEKWAEKLYQKLRKQHG